jgi:hypothetical protein
MRPRSVAVLAILVAAAAAAPAGAAITSSNVTAPADGTHYLVTDGDPAAPAPVTGTTNGTTGDKVDVRCYERADAYDRVQEDVAVAADGSFSTTMSTDDPYGVCILKAVPAGLADTADTSTFTGPTLTGEQNVSNKIPSGPNAGTMTGFYVLFQQPKALNDYVSATEGGIYDARLQHGPGNASAYIWYEDGSLRGDDPGDNRSGIQVDGRNAYGPKTARDQLADNPGLPGLTYDVSRDAASGDTTIHEVDPIVVCPNETPFPPTSASCPQFNSAGVVLERTWTSDDGGLQIHMTDTWRSTDNAPHTLSLRYEEWVSGYAPNDDLVPIAFQLPWLGDFATFSTDTVFPGPAPGAGTIFVRDNNNAPDGSDVYLVGAISYSLAPTDVRRLSRQELQLRNENVSVPAGGTFVIRQDYVIGQSLAEVTAKATANADRLGGPTLSISSPANGSTVTGAKSTQQVMVTGSATDNGGLTALTLNGAAVTPAGDGTFSAPVTLKLGANTLTLVGTDHPGNTATATATATYADNVAPALTGFKAKPATFRRKRGTTFKLKLSEDAAVTITIARRHGKRLVKSKTVRRNLKAGKRSLKFKSKLAPGRYVATASAADTAANKSKKKTARLRVRR